MLGLVKIEFLDKNLTFRIVCQVKLDKLGEIELHLTFWSYGMLLSNLLGHPVKCKSHRASSV